MNREALIPPPVDDAHAPMIISAIKIHFDNIGHRLKSAVAYPVVVIIVPTWKTA